MKKETESMRGTRTIMKFLIWGMAIFAFTVTLWSVSFFYDLEIKIFSEWKDRKEEQFSDLAQRPAISPKRLNTVLIELDARTASRQRYLELCVSMARDLKEYQAKAVFIFFPDELLATDKNLALVNKMQKTGIVVFARPPIIRDNQRKVTVPFYNKAMIPWGVLSVQSDLSFVPFGYNESYAGYDVPDAALPVIGCFKGYPADIRIQREQDRVRYGEFEIPTLPDGTSLVKPNQWRMGWLPWDYWVPIFDSTKWTDLASLIPEDPGRFKAQVKDKIIVVSWYSEFVDVPTIHFRSTRVVIENILNKQFIVYERRMTLLMVMLLLTFSGIICYVFKPLVSIDLLLVSAVGLCGVSYWLLDSKDVYVQFLYPLLSIVLSIGFFPAVKLSSERAALAEQKKQLEDEEKSRLQKELQTAHDMQMGLMPASDPIVSGFDISGLCRPAEEVGGDYFDYVWLNEEKTRLGIAVADVSGKAMKAAITAVMTSGMVYREVGTNETPKGILRKINRPMYLKTDKRIFTAMSFAVIDTETQKLAFSNAGQMQPFLKRKAAIEPIKVDGSHLPLGMTEDVEYHELTISLERGDTIVFYTDGIPEAMNKKDEMFGFERLESIVKDSAADLSAKQVAAKIVQKVADFAGSAKQHDDMTVVVVRVL